MNRPSIVEGDGSLRLFCGLRFPDDALDRLVEWQRAELADADGRIVRRDQLHITLAFLGRTPPERVDDVAEALREAASVAEPPSLQAVRYRETRSVGMVVLAEEAERSARLQLDLVERLEALGVYKREQRPWLPHVTVLRFRQRPRLDLHPPDLGLVVPSDAALYNSVLRSTGAQYEVLESVALGG